MKFAQLIGQRGFWSLLPLGTSPSGLQRGALRPAGAGPRFPLSGAFQPPNPWVCSPSVSPPIPVCLSFHWSRLPTCSLGPRGPDVPPSPAAARRGWGEWRAPGCPSLPCPAISRLSGPSLAGGREVSPAAPRWDFRIEEWELGREEGKWKPRSGEQGGSTEMRAGFHSGSCPVLPAALGSLSQDFRGWGG